MTTVAQPAPLVLTSSPLSGSERGAGGVRFIEVPDPWSLVEIVVTAGNEAPARQHATTLDVDRILDLFESWIVLDVADGAPARLTLQAYRTDVAILLRWLADQGIVSVAHVTLDTLKAFRAYLVKGDATHRPYRVTTVRRKLASIRRFFALARSHGALPVDPAVGLKSPADRTRRAERIRYLELEDLARLLAATAAAATPQAAVRDRAIISLMAYHGLRRCEVRALDVADLDLRTADAQTDDWGSVTVHGKGNKQRTVYLVYETADALRKWLAVRRLMGRNDGCAAVFVQLHTNLSGPAGRLSHQAINELLDRYLTKCGLKQPGVSCHILRHTCATQALDAGAGLLEIGDMLGHAKIDTTTIYAHVLNRRANNPAKTIKLAGVS